MLKILKKDKLFIVAVLAILAAGGYFYATCIPVKHTIRRDYTGMEYAPDMSVVSDSVSLHVYGYYYDYLIDTYNSDYFRGKFEISNVPETMNTEAYFLIHDSFLEPNGDKKEMEMYYLMCDGVLGNVFMERKFLKTIIALSDSYNNNVVIFPAENHEQAVGVYNELESILYGSNLKNLFSK